MKKLHFLGLIMCMYMMACQPVLAKSVDPPKTELSYFITDDITVQSPEVISTLNISPDETFCYCISDRSTSVAKIVTDYKTFAITAELKNEPTKNANSPDYFRIDQSIQKAGFILHYTNRRGEIYFPGNSLEKNGGSANLSPPPCNKKKPS